MPEDLKKMAMSERRLLKDRRARDEKARKDRVKRYKEREKVKDKEEKFVPLEVKNESPNPLVSFFHRD